MIKLDIKVGDTILRGKFRNKKVVVKSIGEDEHGSPTVNGKSILSIRLVKKEEMKESFISKILKEGIEPQTYSEWIEEGAVGGQNSYSAYYGDEFMGTVEYNAEQEGALSQRDTKNLFDLWKRKYKPDQINYGGVNELMLTFKRDVAPRTNDNPLFYPKKK